MPLYRYLCESCGTRQEVLAKISDPPPEACKKCGGGPLSKVVSRTGFRLAGGGWYAQGYDGASNTSATNSGGEGSGDGGAASGSSSED